jgi:hypothetical protein
MQVSSLKITADPRDARRHHIKLLVQSYFASADTAVKDNKKPKADAKPGGRS